MYNKHEKWNYGSIFFHCLTHTAIKSFWRIWGEVCSLSIWCAVSGILNIWRARRENQQQFFHFLHTFGHRADSWLPRVHFQSSTQSCVLNIDLVTSAHDPWPVMLTPCPGGWVSYISQLAVSIDYLPGTCSEKWSQGECLSWEPFGLCRQQGLASALHLNRLWVALVNQSP